MEGLPACNFTKINLLPRCYLINFTIQNQSFGGELIICKIISLFFLPIKYVINQKTIEKAIIYRNFETKQMLVSETNILTTIQHLKLYHGTNRVMLKIINNLTGIQCATGLIKHVMNWYFIWNLLRRNYRRENTTLFIARLNHICMAN